MSTAVKLGLKVIRASFVLSTMIVFAYDAVGESVPFVDNFQDTLGSGWVWVDPNNDCSYSLSEAPGYMRITVPLGGNDLWSGTNYNAPRLIRPISGDFVIETKVMVNPTVDYQSAGFFVGKDGATYGRFAERKYYPNGGGSLIDDISCDLTTLYLRLIRKGDVFTDQYSTDGTDWITLHESNLALTDPINVGVFVINEWQNNPFSADFDYIRISLTGETGVGDEHSTTPKSFMLLQNYPNPFNQVTTISFSLPVSGNVTLKIYNVLGEEIATLVQKDLSAGIHKVGWNANEFANGIYFYRLNAGSFTDVKKLLLLK